MPGVKLQYDSERVYAFVGAKSAVVARPRDRRAGGGARRLAGAGVDVTDMLRVEVNGGYFDRGANELQDVNREKVRLFGASVQVSVHKGMPVTLVGRLRLYRNDPSASRLFPGEVPGRPVLARAAEFTMLGQTLKDPEDVGATKIQGATPATSTCASSSTASACASTCSTATSRSSCTPCRRCRRTRTSPRPTSAPQLLRRARRRPQLGGTG